MAERISQSDSSIFASASKYGDVTPNDSTPLNFKALYIGGAGSIVIKSKSDAPATTFQNVPVGILSVAGVRVMAASTANDIVWLSW